MAVDGTLPAAGAGRLRRLRAAVATPGGYRRLSLVTLGALLAIIPSGAYVRLTDSGLGCPDWPSCHGGAVPPLSGHAWIEYSNRILSALVIAVCALAWLGARALPGAPRALRRWSLAATLATLAQGPLGAVTVLADLNPLLVASHFLVSLVALAFGVLLALAAADFAGGVRRRWEPRRAVAACVALASLAAVVVTGILVTAAGPHSGDPKVVRRIGSLTGAAAVHVRAVIAFAAIACALAVVAVRRGWAERSLRRLALVMLPVIALQVGIGEYQYRHHLPWQVVGIHVTVAGCLWALGVAIAALLARPAAPAPPATTGAEASRGLRELTRSGSGA